MNTPICPYCGNPSKRTKGQYIYPHLPKLVKKVFYQCKPCDAHVGTHPGTHIPLGDLAGKELRRYRSKAHAAFDKLWKEKLFPSRSAAYRWLCEIMNKSGSDCHIAMFNIDECQIVINESSRYYSLNKPNSIFMGL